MKLKNVLIVVSNIEKSKKFYKELFGLEVLIENEGNAVLTEGLVLQDKKIWEEHIRREILVKNNAYLLYFEERNIEKFVKKLEELYPEIDYQSKLITLDWGQKMLRFYDFDGNLIEVRSPVE